MVKPPQLLKDFGVIWVVRNNTLIRVLGSCMIFLLFINVADLEPDVGMGEGARWISKNTIETGKRVFIFALLFVDDAETEEYFVSLVEVLVHTKDRRESLLGMVQGTISIVKYANSIPELWILLWIWEKVKGLLIGRVGLLKVVLHEVTMT